MVLPDTVDRNRRQVFLQGNVHTRSGKVPVTDPLALQESGYHNLDVFVSGACGGEYGLAPAIVTTRFIAGRRNGLANARKPRRDRSLDQRMAHHFDSQRAARLRQASQLCYVAVQNQPTLTTIGGLKLPYTSNSRTSRCRSNRRPIPSKGGCRLRCTAYQMRLTCTGSLDRNDGLR